MIYLDNSATTALSSTVKSAMCSAMENFGNPSSLHAAGTQAHAAVEDARRSILGAAGLKFSDGWQVIFTGSGSEASNLALIGAANAKNHFDSKRVFITDSEHPSVENCALRLEKEGFETLRIPTKGGRIDLEFLETELKKGAFIVSVMLVNNETGALYDIKAASELTRRLCPSALVHCDAVQGFMRVPLPVRYTDMITVSAHKIHGPKGVGALLVSPSILKKRALSPVIFGGGQEQGLRSGTENVIGIAGFGAAAAEGRENYTANAEKIKALWDYAVPKIRESGAAVNVPVVPAGHIISVTLPDIKSQTMLNYLSSRGICVSSGSACSSHDRHISTALRAFGLTDREADSTVRVSLCADNTFEDIDALAEALKDGISSLVRIRK